MVEVQESTQSRAIQFATLQSNEIQITHEAMSFLGSLPCDQKIAIVTLVGPVNTGKSNLANRLVDAKEDGFPLRQHEAEQTAETQKTSTTSGIMMWNSPIKLKDGSKMLVLDMQGLPPPTPAQSSMALMRSPRTSALRSPRGVVNRSNPTDRLLAFASLISSMVVYTHKGATALQETIAECLEPVAKFSDMIQKEIGAELGQTTSVLSTGSAGNISARSFGASQSVLDITTTVASDLKDIVCQSMLVVMTDFETTDVQKQDGIMQRKAAKLAFEASFTPCSGVTSETIRKNKAIECFKNIFPHRAVLSIAPQATDAQTHSKDLNRLVGTIKRKAVHKAVYGKALNGNMLLNLALEYAETLSQPQTSLSVPGKNSTYGSLMLLFHAFYRVSEEEMLRISDTVLADFKDELRENINEQTMPLSDKILSKVNKQLQEKYRMRLRKDLADIATFEEVMNETEKIEERMRQLFDLKRQENYSQGYYFAIGLLKQLYGQEFGEDTELVSADDIKAKWLSLTNDFKFGSGEESHSAKWDVFAECLIRLPAEQQRRFVDYTQVECEQAVDLADETASDTMGEGQREVGGVPSDLLNEQMQIMSLFEAQIERMKQQYQDQLTGCQIEAQKTYQHHQQLEQAKKDNELKMSELKAQGDQIVQQKNDMQLQVQAVDHERAEIETELERMGHVTNSEQQKHKAQLEKQSTVGEVELTQSRQQAEELRAQLAEIQEKLIKEEQEGRSEVQNLESEIQARREEQDQMEQALAHNDNTALLSQVNQFFGQEVPEQYLAKIKEVFGGNTQEAKDLKLKLFEEQRKLNDVDYQYTQDQLKLKQRHDEEFKIQRQSKERELKEAQLRYDQVRQKHLENTQKKESTNYSLQRAMQTCEERQDQVISLNETKDETQQKIDGDVSKIVELKAVLSEAGMSVETLEHQIYELSIQNLNQLAVKERLIELTSEIVKSSQRGKPTPEMLAILRSLPDERVKSRLELVLVTRSN